MLCEIQYPCVRYKSLSLYIPVRGQEGYCKEGAQDAKVQCRYGVLLVDGRPDMGFKVALCLKNCPVAL